MEFHLAGINFLAETADIKAVSLAFYGTPYLEGGGQGNDGELCDPDEDEIDEEDEDERERTPQVCVTKGK